MGLNRIYQGRVVSCQDECGNKIGNFEKLLFEHHQLFQDAVNYYLFALAAEARKRAVSAVSLANSAETTGITSPLGSVICVVLVGLINSSAFVNLNVI